MKEISSNKNKSMAKIVTPNLSGALKRKPYAATSFEDLTQHPSDTQLSSEEWEFPKNPRKKRQSSTSRGAHILTANNEFGPLHDDVKSTAQVTSKMSLEPSSNGYWFRWYARVRTLAYQRIHWEHYRKPTSWTLKQKLLAEILLREMRAIA